MAEQVILALIGQALVMKIRRSALYLGNHGEVLWEVAPSSCNQRKLPVMYKIPPRTPKLETATGSIPGLRLNKFIRSAVHVSTGESVCLRLEAHLGMLRCTDS
jgi:hypothetical protein